MNSNPIIESIAKQLSVHPTFHRALNRTSSARGRVLDWHMENDSTIKMEIEYKDPLNMSITRVDQVILSVSPGLLVVPRVGDEVIVHFTEGEASHVISSVRSTRLKDERQAGGDYTPRTLALFGAGVF